MPDGLKLASQSAFDLRLEWIALDTTSLSTRSTCTPLLTSYVTFGLKLEDSFILLASFHCILHDHPLIIIIILRVRLSEFLGLVWNHKFDSNPLAPITRQCFPSTGSVLVTFHRPLVTMCILDRPRCRTMIHSLVNK